MAVQQDYKIAAGNNNAAGLAVLIGVIPSGDQYPFYPMDAYGRFQQGEPTVRMDSQLYLRGYPAHSWAFSIMTWIQFAYLKTTYCNGGYAGLVTIRTRTTVPGTFANYNAVLHLPQEAAMTPLGRDWWRNVVLNYIKVEAI